MVRIRRMIGESAIGRKLPDRGQTNEWHYGAPVRHLIAGRVVTCMREILMQYLRPSCPSQGSKQEVRPDGNEHTVVADRMVPAGRYYMAQIPRNLSGRPVDCTQHMTLQTVRPGCSVHHRVEGNPPSVMFWHQ